MRTTFIFVLALLVATLKAWADEYVIKVESNGEQVAVVELSIDGDSANAKVGDENERFDLKNQRWQDAESGQWVSLAQCETWAKQSKEKSSKSSASVPENIQRFVAWSLAPAFAVKATDKTVAMTSGQVDYEITVKKSDRDLTNYFRYARLNAYKKAMTERKLPPFAELKVLDELEQRKLMPTSMVIRIPGIPGAPTIKMVIEEK